MRTPRHHLTAILATVALTMAIPLRSEEMPQITGESLSGKQVSLPASTTGSVAIICIGFSHASQGEVKAWAERARNRFGGNHGIVIYSVAVLEDAPRFVRGMAVHGMKSGVPQQQHDHFIVIYHGESELKRVTGFVKPEEAYVLVLNDKGNIEWRTHGPASDAAFQELEGHMHSSNSPE